MAGVVQEVDVVGGVRGPVADAFQKPAVVDIHEPVTGAVQELVVGVHVPVAGVVVEPAGVGVHVPVYFSSILVASVLLEPAVMILPPEGKILFLVFRIFVTATINIFTFYFSGFKI